MKKIGILVVVLMLTLLLSGCAMTSDLNILKDDVMSNQEVFEDYQESLETTLEDYENRINELLDEIESLNNTLNNLNTALTNVIEFNQNQTQDKISNLEEELDKVKAEYEDKISLLESQIDTQDVQSKLDDVIKKTSTSVVSIRVFIEDSYIGLGSGVIYKELNGVYYLFTNYHVIEDGESFKIRIKDNVEVDGYVAGFDYYLDLAILKFNSNENLELAQIKSEVGVGTFVLAIGSPSSSINYNSATFGIVSGLKRPIGYTRSDYYGELYIQHDAPINPGNSGGGLFDLEGNLIGINTLKSVGESIEGMGYAIPMNSILNVTSYIERGEAYPRAIFDYNQLVNVNYIRNNPSLFPGIFIPNAIKNGVFIDSPTSDSLIFKAGVKNGDVITKISGVEVSFWFEVKHELFYNNLPNAIITFEIIRNEQEILLSYDTSKYNSGYFSYEKQMYSNGFYVGPLFNNIKEGFGYYYFNNDNSYVGDFSNNVFEGFGLFTWSDGVKHLGYFSNGIPNGFGTRTFSNKDYFSAEWTSWIDGSGTYYFYDTGTSEKTDLVNNEWK